MIELVKTVLNSAQNKYENENADNYILRCKNAEVIWYQPMKLIACVRFMEDKNKNEYHLYNRCGAYLYPGDTVKVYYTTNAAKGWIAVRSGVPNYLNEYGQNIYDTAVTMKETIAAKLPAVKKPPLNTMIRKPLSSRNGRSVLKEAKTRSGNMKKVIAAIRLQKYNLIPYHNDREER